MWAFDLSAQVLYHPADTSITSERSDGTFRCPNSLAPQHATVPSDLRAHAWDRPSVTFVTLLNQLVGVLFVQVTVASEWRRQISLLIPPLACVTSWNIWFDHTQKRSQVDFKRQISFEETATPANVRSVGTLLFKTSLPYISQHTTVPSDLRAQAPQSATAIWTAFVKSTGTLNHGSPQHTTLPSDLRAQLRNGQEATWITSESPIGTFTWFDQFAHQCH